MANNQNGRRIPVDRMGLPDLGALARSKKQEQAASGPIQPVVINLAIQLPAATERLGDQLKQIVSIAQAMATEGEAVMDRINQARLAEKMGTIQGLEDGFKFMLSRPPTLESFTEAVKAVCKANGIEFPQPGE
jgi:hypothetical protein